MPPSPNFWAASSSCFSEERAWPIGVLSDSFFSRNLIVLSAYFSSVDHGLGVSALGNGFAYTSLVFAIAAISGGHMNPGMMCISILLEHRGISAFPQALRSY
jgi:hypothetical protein